MPRYVLLAFDNTKEAEDFVQSITTAGSVTYIQPSPNRQSGVEFEITCNVFVRGLYMKPTQFCTCPEQGKWGKNDGWTRGQKFGLWVHDRCGLPSKAWATGDSWYGALGKNLLPVSEQAPEWRGEGVSHHRWDEETRQYLHVITGEPWQGGKQR